jgi:tetratricopeptide (TPR) repeat protein
VSENRQISHRQKVAKKELELSSEEVAKHEEDKQLMNERIQELTNDTEDDILKGIEEAKNGQFENFITTLNVVLEKDKSSATSHTLIGYTHYIQGDLDQAEDAYTSAINESPRVITPYVLRAELREDRDNYNGALKDYNQVVYLDSTKGDAYFKQGLLLYYFFNEQDEGCKSWEMAFKLGVEDANEKLIEHCSESSTSQFYVITQLTKRAIKETYGYDISNPIMVGKNEERQDYNVILYLQLLRDKQGKPVDFVRYGSCCRYSTENGLRGEGLMERYRISYKNEKGKKEQKTLYFSFYDFDKPKVPKGFDTNHDIY